MKFKVKEKVEKGISLTEILIVIAILALLIIAGIRIFTLQILKGNDSKRKADLDRIKIAIEEYEKDNNCYPDPDLMDNCGWNETIPIHPYLSNVPCDPVTKEPYPYETDESTCSRWYRLYALLQNVKDNDIILRIGPNNNYNYYVSSENATVPISGPYIPPDESPTPQPTYGEVYMYGCKSGRCQRIYFNVNNEPECQPNYDDVSCYGQCGSVSSPTNECI